MKLREISIKEISQILKIDFAGKNLIINGLNLCNRDSIYKSLVTYLTSIKYVKYLRSNSKIKAVLVTPEIYQTVKIDFPALSFLIVDNPEEEFYNLHSYLYNLSDFYDHFIFTKIIGSNCHIHKTANIEDGVVLGNEVEIGQYSIIKRGSVIGNNSKIGCCSVIGSEGFQLIKNKDGENKLIEHVGGCNIGNRVHIGDNTIICRSLFEENTIVGNNTKIDNLVHVAHNCIIGKNCVLTAGVILSGSTIIENDVWIAPNSSISNRVILENHSFIGIGSVVIKKVKTGTTIFGNPAKEI